MRRRLALLDYVSTNQFPLESTASTIDLCFRLSRAATGCVDRTRTRGISPAAIDQSLKKLSSIADQLAQMEVNNTVWVYDVANNLGMGLRRISSQNMLFKLKTVVGARPYDGAIPIIELS